MKVIKKLIEKDRHLLKQLFLSFDDVLNKRGKRLSYMRFARPTNNGWSFFKKKKINWNLLEDITHQTVKRHAHCHRAQIADVLSHLVNLTEKDFSQIRTAVL